FSQFFPPKPTWTATLRVSLVRWKISTMMGGNSGIGSEAARVLSKGARVYIATCLAERSQKAIDKPKRETGKTVSSSSSPTYWILSVKAAAEEYIGKQTELHTLYNSGGVHAVIDKATTQGLRFGTNVLGAI
ncbi:hypothetical protein H4582DRAFT_1812757, partial [Lactarius indigo]